MLADFVGSLVLALLVLAVAKFGFGGIEFYWVFAYLMLLAGAFYAWRHEYAPIGAMDWMFAASLAAALGAILYAMAGGFDNPFTWNRGDDPWKDHSELALYAVISFGGCMVSIAGAVRSICLGREVDT
nr:hypothetical protein [uncultured Roseateles sp.]